MDRKEFKRRGNPRRTLGIGLDPREPDQWPSRRKWAEALVGELPSILGREDIPKDLFSPNGMMKSSYLNRLMAYLATGNAWSTIEVDIPFGIIKDIVYGLLEESQRFTRGGNPRERLSIGRERLRNLDNFSSSKEWVEALLPHLPSILGTDGIPPDILGKPGISIISHPYFERLRDFMKKGPTIGHFNSVEVILNLDDALRNLGFERVGGYSAEETETPYMKKTSELSESQEFKRGGNPRTGLGIGVMAQQNFRDLEEVERWIDRAIPHLIGRKTFENLIDGIEKKFYHRLLADPSDTNAEYLMHSSYLFSKAALSIERKLKERSDIKEISGGYYWSHIPIRSYIKSALYNHIRDEIKEEIEGLFPYVHIIW